MPRSYGITNAAPWASAPPVGPAGDMYYNTTSKTFWLSDGTQWNQIQGGGGGAPYSPVASTPPPASSPTISPPMGLLWVDTSTTPAAFQGPPGIPDQGVNSGTPDMNTIQTTGIYVMTGSPVNPPPCMTTPYVLEVQTIGNGTYIQQRATSIGYDFIASRWYSGGSWQPWQLAAGSVFWRGSGSTGSSFPTGSTPFTLTQATQSGGCVVTGGNAVQVPVAGVYAVDISYSYSVSAQSVTWRYGIASFHNGSGWVNNIPNQQMPGDTTQIFYPQSTFLIICVAGDTVGGGPYNGYSSAFGTGVGGTVAVTRVS